MVLPDLMARVVIMAKVAMEVTNLIIHLDHQQWLVSTRYANWNEIELCQELIQVTKVLAQPKENHQQSSKKT